MYWSMSLSITASARVYARFPLPPATSASWTPPSSLYCFQRSASSSSAAARNLRIAASPAGSPSPASAAGVSIRNLPAPRVRAPAAAPLTRKDRRLVRCSDDSFIDVLLFGGTGGYRACNPPQDLVRVPEGGQGRGGCSWVGVVSAVAVAC